MGSVARLDERLNTFYGNVSRKRVTVFDCAGKVLNTTVAYSDLETKKSLGAADALPFGSSRER
jgi:hypothetical protein